MKSSDLMLGDWVDCEIKKLENETLTSLFAKVVGLNSTNGILLIEYEGKRKFAHENDVKPVEISREILEKVGFERHKGSENILGPYYDYHGDVGQILRLIYNGHHFEFHIYYGYHFEIKYVHELQHFLKFCGIEKDVVL